MRDQSRQIRRVGTTAVVRLPKIAALTKWCALAHAEGYGGQTH
jgi:hypothetical protein